MQLTFFKKLILFTVKIITRHIVCTNIFLSTYTEVISLKIGKGIIRDSVTPEV